MWGEQKMQPKSIAIKHKQRSEKNNFQKKLSKWIPYMIGGLFVYTLYQTQFFHYFSYSGREAYESHLMGEEDTSFVFELSTPQNVVDLMFNLQGYFTHLMTQINLNQVYSFLSDGFAFGRNVRGNTEISEQSLEYRFVRHEQMRYTEAELTVNPHRMPISAEPLVYLFNSHPAEMIGATFADRYVGEMNIVEVSHLMAEAFREHGITALVEERSVLDILAARSWSFPRSYDASRVFLEETINQYDSLRFFFDIHRDGIPRHLGTVEIDGVSYARVLLVIGLRNPVGHQANYKVAREIHERLEARYPGLSRGIQLHGSFDQEGNYNQDLGATVQLFEIGTVESTAEEAKNTVRALTSVLAEYIRDQMGN